MPKLLILVLAACIIYAQQNSKESTRILVKKTGKYTKHGWNHYGPGYFTLDSETGVLKSHGGMGLLWYSKKKYKNFTLELDYKTSEPKANSGIFLRVPDIPASDDYIYHSFEIQINNAGKGKHKTAAVYDGQAASKDASKPAGEWKLYKITFHDSRIPVELIGEQGNDCLARPSGKVTDFSDEGYIGLQNHDWDTNTYFKNIYIKEL